MQNEAAIQVYEETITRLVSAANVIANSTHMTVAAQAHLTVEPVGNAHLEQAHNHICEAIREFKEQYEAILESEMESELVE